MKTAILLAASLLATSPAYSQYRMLPHCAPSRVTVSGFYYVPNYAPMPTVAQYYYPFPYKVRVPVPVPTSDSTVVTTNPDTDSIWNGPALDPFSFPPTPLPAPTMPAPPRQPAIITGVWIGR